MPEQTAQAHIDLNGKLLLPIHWGKFKLSLHPWTEPVERLETAADAMNIKVITPKIGEILNIDDQVATEKWWRKENFSEYQ